MEGLGEILSRVRVQPGLSQDAIAISSVGELTEEPACLLCGDAGFVRMDLPVGHPDFGRPFPCRCSLAEGGRQRRERLQRYSNLGGLIGLTFDTLIARGRSSDNADQELFAEAVVAAKEFAERPSGWLVIAGSSGCGKTHLASAIAKFLD